MLHMEANKGNNSRQAEFYKQLNVYLDWGLWTSIYFTQSLISSAYTLIIIETSN